jgi:hypothetical protein
MCDKFFKEKGDVYNDKIYNNGISLNESDFKHKQLTLEDFLEALNIIKAYNLQLQQPPVSGSLPSKDEVVNVGFRKATNADYNFRKVCKDLDHDLYYSGWMDCYDWLSGNDR